MKYFNESKRKYIDWLKHNFIDANAIEVARAVNTPFYHKQPRLRSALERWIVLPFHPDLARIGLGRVVNEIVDTYSCLLASAGTDVPKISIAWKNTLPSMHQQILRIFFGPNNNNTGVV